MNPEIRRLQYLNDLIAQTLDVINQRVASQQIPVGGGLSHSPYQGGVSPWQQGGMSHSPYQGALPWQPMGPQSVPPMQQQVGMQPLGGHMGLSHTPFYGPESRFGFDPRFASFGGQGVDPRFAQSMIPQGAAGLSHTPYDPRFPTGIGAAPVWGMDPRMIGYPFGW